MFVQPGSYSKHNSNVLKYVPTEGEPQQVEYRVDVKEDEKLIYRVDFKGKKIYVIAVVFILVDFLDNIKKYQEGDIVVNSKEERELLN